MLLDTLKRDLKDLVGNSQHEEVFRRLKGEILRSNCERYNDAIGLQSRYSLAKGADLRGTLEFQDKNLAYNKTTEALLALIDNICMADLSDTLQTSFEQYRTIPEFHAYTCDRYAQNDHFQLSYYGDAAPEKIRIFYLFGDVRQSHESLHERLGRDLGGHLLNWESGDFEPETKVLFKTLKPTVHRIPLLYKIEVVKTLFAKFFPQLRDKEPIQNKTIADLMSSPELQTLGPNDFVFVLLTMDDANWNKDVTPIAVEAFISSFLSAKLPDSAPTFFFFFGMEYAKNNPVKQQEVREAVQNRKLGGEALEELTPVAAADISEWFSRYRKIMVERGKEPSEMTEAIFGNIESIDMKELEAKLLELICRHNKGLAIRAEDLKRNR